MGDKCKGYARRSTKPQEVGFDSPIAYFWVINMKVNYFDLGLWKGQEIEHILNLFKDVTIFGVEANPKFYRSLEEKYKGYKNVNLYNFAIGSQSGVCKLYLEKKWGGIGSSIYPDKNNVAEDYIEVNSIRFSDWYKSLSVEEGYNILKANIEGAEYDLVLDLDESSLFGEFDLLIGSTDGWMTDMHKVKSLCDKISQVKEILDRNQVTVHSYFDGEQFRLEEVIKNNVPLNKMI